MKLSVTEKGTRLILSKRNLLSLLDKLDWEESARTLELGIARLHIDLPDGSTGVLLPFQVSVEEDEEHYTDDAVPPGMMHPITEASLAIKEH